MISSHSYFYRRFQRWFDRIQLSGLESSRNQKRENPPLLKLQRYLKETFFAKQEEIFLDSQSFSHILLYGAMGSGKTFLALGCFLHFLFQMKESQGALLTGYSLPALQRNLFPLLSTILEEIRIPYQFRLDSQGRIQIGVYFIYCLGLHEERAKKRIRGMNLRLWFGNEMALIEKSLTFEVLTRIRIHNPKIIWDTNPSYPNHYLKTQFIDNPAVNFQSYGFKMEDNPFLPQEYCKNFETLFQGSSEYQRNYLGLWASDQQFPFSQMKIGEFKVQGYIKGFLDPAFGGGDKTAIAFGYVSYEESAKMNYYVYVDEFEESVFELKEILLQRIKKYSIQELVIEENGDQGAFLKSFEDYLIDHKEYTVFLKGKRVFSKKEERIVSWIGSKLNQIILHSHSNAIHSILSYQPKTRQKDDAVDALASLIHELG